VFKPYDWIIGGLFVDIAGAVVLASSFMLKTPAQAADEAATRFGQNIALFRSALYQRNEAWCGATLLAGGFIFQMIGNYQNALNTMGVGVLHSWPRVIVAGILSWVLAYLLLVAFRLDARERFLEHVFASVSAEDRDKAVPADSAFRMARLWDVRVQRDETATELAVRLTELRKSFVPLYVSLARLHGTRSPAQIIQEMRDRYD
jgi:hypothetical protein